MHARPRVMDAPRFIVSIHGQQRCIAGFDGNAVLTIMLSAHVVAEGDPERPRSSLIHCAADLRVGGLQHREHVDWINEQLFVGDEVKIRVVDGAAFDPPKTRGRSPRSEPGTCADYRPILEARRERLEKAGNITPARFQVLVNDEQLCTAGIESGILTADITWVRRDPADQGPDSDESTESWIGGEVDVSVSALEKDVHLHWNSGYADAGDELTIRVLGPGPFDPPVDRENAQHIPHEEKTVVAGPRVTMRLLVNDDLEFVSDLLGDAETVRHLHPPLERDQAKKWLKRHATHRERYRTMYLIVDRESHRPIGVAGILQTRVEGQSLPLVKCVVHPSYRREKYATHASQTCIEIVHNPTPWSELKSSDAYALIEPGNIAGLALARKLRMELLRDVQHDGRGYQLFVAKDRGK